MSRIKKKVLRRPLPAVALGSAVAETDNDLSEYYVSNPYLDRAKDIADRTVFFLGDKGTGKSALLEMVDRTIHGPKIIRLGADDIGLGLLSNPSLLGSLGSVDLGMIYRAVWDYIILISIVKKEYGTSKPSWFVRLVPKDEREVFDLLAQVGELDKGTLQLGKAFVEVLGRVQVKLTASSPDGGTYGAEVSLKKKGNSTEIGSMMTEIRIMKHITRLRKELPKKCKHSQFFILIDDLDEGWNNTPAQRECLRALVSSLIRLQHFENVKFLIALRTIIFDQLKVDNPDKVREHIAHLSWTKGNLTDIIMRRLHAALGRSQRDIMENVLPEKVKGMAPMNFMYANLPRHPRSHIQFMQHALDRAVEDGQRRIRATDFHCALTVMSKYFAEDIAFEYRTRYPGLQQLLPAMSGCRTEMSLKEMRLLMDKMILSAIEKNDVWELQWIRDIAERGHSEEEMNDTLCRDLIGTGVIGLKPSRTELATFHPKHIPPVFPKKVWFKVSPYLVQYLATN